MVVDGNQMFNRPGPRLVDALEWLAALLHPGGGGNGGSGLQQDGMPPGFPWRPFLAPQQGGETAGAAASSACAATAAPGAAHAKALDVAHDSTRSALEAAGSGVVGVAVPRPDGAVALRAAFDSALQGLRRQKAALPADIEDAHCAACAAGSPTYPDPKTRYTVFTADHHLSRGACCGNGCRHCPFGHFNVVPRNGVTGGGKASRTAAITSPQLLLLRKEGVRPAAGAAEALPPGLPTLVTWMGDDASAAAARRVTAAGEGPCLLLVAFDASTGRIWGDSRQDVFSAMDACHALRLPMVAVPVPPASDVVCSAAAAWPLFREAPPGVDLALSWALQQAAEVVCGHSAAAQQLRGVGGSSGVSSTAPDAASSTAATAGGPHFTVSIIVSAADMSAVAPALPGWPPADASLCNRITWSHVASSLQEALSLSAKTASLQAGVRRVNVQLTPPSIQSS